MMTGTPPDPAAGEWLAEVLEQLGLPRSASAAEARVALLRQLPEQGFVPPPAWQQAVSWMLQPAQKPLIADEEVRQAAEAAVRADVEKLAVEFFQLAVAERQRRWNELMARCNGLPALYARLKALEAGLDITGELTDHREPKLRELSVLLRELFVLRPVERARRRQAFLERIKPDPQSWERAAQRLRRHHADWADLEPVLVDQLARWSAEQKRADKWRRRHPGPESSVWARLAQPGFIGWVGIILYAIIFCALLLPHAFNRGSRRPMLVSDPPPVESPNKDLFPPKEPPKEEDGRQPLFP